MRTINVTEFKAKCLALVEEVGRTGEVLTILKHGRPVARVVPPTAAAEGYPQDALRGTVKILGDIVGPTGPTELWEAEEPARR
jgi:prevent-host-death family protein